MKLFCLQGRLKRSKYPFYIFLLFVDYFTIYNGVSFLKTSHFDIFLKFSYFQMLEIIVI